MLTKTTISAIRALLYLAQQEPESCLSPRKIAEAIGDSPTYLAKSLRLLVKAGILRAEKGVHGGVRLGRDPAQISLLAVVETCQGTIIGDYCQSTHLPFSALCSFHQAAEELHRAITGVLSRWTLAALLERPHPPGGSEGGLRCLMAGRQPSRRPHGEPVVTAPGS